MRLNQSALLKRKLLISLLVNYIHLTAGTLNGPILDNYSPCMKIQLSNEQYKTKMTTKFSLKRAVSHVALAIAKYTAVHKISGEINLMKEGFCLLVRASQKYFPINVPKISLWI